MLAILAAVMLAAAPQHDTVFTADGGRVVGTVVEDSAQSVAVQLPDGTFRRLPRREVVRIEYSDGSVSTRPAAPAAPPVATPQPQPPAAPPPAYAPPPPTYAPPPPPPAYRPAPYYGRPMPPPQWAPRTTGPIMPFWFDFGLGGMFYGGNVEPGYSANGTFGSQMNLSLEGGFRLNPYLGLGLYFDSGVGGPGGDIRNECNANGVDCTAYTTRFGLLLRHTFLPYARTTPWLSIGTGAAHGSVDYSGNGSGSFLEYSGWEMVRLMGGVDIRSSQVLGVGLYAGVGFTRYSDYRDANVGSVSLPNETTHTMVEAGVRLTLFP